MNSTVLVFYISKVYTALQGRGSAADWEGLGGGELTRTSVFLWLSLRGLAQSERSSAIHIILLHQNRRVALAQRQPASYQQSRCHI